MNKLKNANCKKFHIVTKLKNSNYDPIQIASKLKLELQQKNKLKCDKLKNSNCDKTQNSNYDRTQNLKLWKTKIVTKLNFKKKKKIKNNLTPQQPMHEMYPGQPFAILQCFCLSNTHVEVSLQGWHYNNFLICQGFLHIMGALIVKAFIYIFMKIVTKELWF